MKNNHGIRGIAKYTGKLFLYQAISSLMTLFMCLGILAFMGKGWWQLILVSGVPSIIIYAMAYLDAWKFGFSVRGATGTGRGLVNIGGLRLDAFIGALLFELPSVVLYLLFAFFRVGWATFAFLVTRYNFYGIYFILEDGEGWRYVIPFLFLLAPLLALAGFNLGSRDIEINEVIRYGKNR